jgi:hypothetical protein
MIIVFLASHFLLKYAAKSTEFFIYINTLKTFQVKNPLHAGAPESLASELAWFVRGKFAVVGTGLVLSVAGIVRWERENAFGKVPCGKCWDKLQAELRCSFGQGWHVTMLHQNRLKSTPQYFTCRGIFPSPG